jgi:UDP-3-O-[3-hydroxymyristoyl] glucosamine N-acyltransferase
MNRTIDMIIRNLITEIKCIIDENEKLRRDVEIGNKVIINQQQEIGNLKVQLGEKEESKNDCSEAR